MSLPQIIFVCDFPPSNHQGGSILAARLLADYPADSLTILTGTTGFNASPPDGRPERRPILFPTNNGMGRRGWGRLKTAINWLMIPALTLAIVWQILRKNIKVSITISHGYFFIAGALAAALTSTRLVLIVHDDWVTATNVNSYLLKYFSARLFGIVSRRADHVYAVSHAMQELLKTTYHTESELQLPATEPLKMVEAASPNGNGHKSLRIVYSGIGHTAYLEGLDVLIGLLKSESLRPYGISSWELHLYSDNTQEEARARGWEHQGIITHGWVSQDELRRGLAQADILFVPLSFAEDHRYFVERSFPSKTADYLASGKPILVLGPPYSGLVKYASQCGFAEVVEEDSKEKLVEKIAYIANSTECRERLLTNSRATLDDNHNIHAQRASFHERLSHLARN
jgi:hypothetical protein